ncbi:MULTISPECIES: hypothetical protein [unclassified Streptomyces]|uniref:hypothetical protein n=1 Tax=unclassified Streptomyces TaxID=2593676 RepID=UPI000B870566|nr:MULTISPECIES: hypothetical protein [unclassified Streptomyces]
MTTKAAARPKRERTVVRAVPAPGRRRVEGAQRISGAGGVVGGVAAGGEGPFQLALEAAVDLVACAGAVGALRRGQAGEAQQQGAEQLAQQVDGGAVGVRLRDGAAVLHGEFVHGGVPGMLLVRMPIDKVLAFRGVADRSGSTG